MLEAAEEALRKGVRALVVISAGFAEIGSEGARRQERAAGARACARCAADRPQLPGHRAAATSLNATFAARSAPSGKIGFSSQSGALGLALLEAAEARGLGLSAFVSIGNKADVSSNDLLEWWEDDPATDVVLLYLESFGNPRRFGRLARRVARRKPMLALKSGTTATGKRAASSHTAALAGSDAAVDALFHQAGVIRAASLEELIDVAALLSSQPEPRGAALPCSRTPAGSGFSARTRARRRGSSCRSSRAETRAALAAMLSAEASAANPVDMLGGATAATYAEALPALLADPQVDAVIVLFVPTVTATAERGRRGGRRPPRAANGDKPVLAVVMSAGGMPAPLRRAGGTSRRSPTRSRRRGRSAAPPSARSGCGGRTGSCRRSTASTGRRPSRSSRGRSPTGEDVWLGPADEARAPRRRTGFARRGATGGERGRGGRRGARARLPGRRQDGRPRRAQDRERRRGARPRGRGGGRAAAGRIGAPCSSSR